MEQTLEQHAELDYLKVTAPAVAGELHLHEFQSEIYRNQRYLRVWLPPGYDDEANQNRNYPVFYLNDGQNLFEPTTAFGGVDWQVDDAADRLIREGVVPPMIIVGIDNTGSDRLREYVPCRMMRPPVLRPGGKRYPDFLIEEVMPFIEQRYRIAPEAKNTGLGGSSLGGAITLYTVIRRPGVFGRVLIESPSLFIGNKRLLRLSRKLRQWPERIVIAIGSQECGREDADRRTVENVKELERIIRASQLGPDRLAVNIVEGASHAESEWAKRFPDSLAFLFGN
ncbi:MAG: alpha/beta hydrolase [Acidobacteriales bacterium]|nr:alpha/beta hydrolase [Terriglobales bacterium]